MYSTYVSFIYLSKLSDGLSLHLHVCSLLEVLIYILWLLLIIIFCDIWTWTACVYYDAFQFVRNKLYMIDMYIYAAYISHNKTVMFR